MLSFLRSSGSRKKEVRYVCPSEAKASLRLKILMTSGSKKRNPDVPSFLSKVQANEPPPGHLAYLSKNLSSRVPRKELPEAPSTEPL
jgi:hypothetical protein